MALKIKEEIVEFLLNAGFTCTDERQVALEFFVDGAGIMGDVSVEDLSAKIKKWVWKRKVWKAIDKGHGVK